MTTKKTYPKGTTESQWTRYYEDKAKHDEFCLGQKPEEPTSLFFPDPASLNEAMNTYRHCYAEWERMRFMDAPNKPGYEFANNH